MTEHAYLFETKGIGEYIADTGRLIDLIGGSDLVAGLCSSQGDDLLQKVLEATDAEGMTKSRRAGGAFCLHDTDRDRLDRVRALWRLAVGLSCPGLSFTDTDPVSSDDAGADTGAQSAAIAALTAAYLRQPGLRENSAALLPPTGQPVTETSRRTGRVATTRASSGRMGREDDRLDGVVAAQRARGKRIAQSASEDRLARLFLPSQAEEHPPYRFPRHFERDEASPGNPAFPFRAGDRRVAVVHADISGLGQVFRQITRQARDPAEVRTAAQCIEDAIAAAARGASEAALLDHAVDVDVDGHAVLPARPVIVGGDDITIIVRADLAMAFACELLERIEQATQDAFRGVRQLGLPSHLTACAGVAIVGASHPFLAANRMAEGMCRNAKTWVKARAMVEGTAVPASALTFGVITSTVDEAYSSWRDREQRLAPTRSGPRAGTADAVYATACPYLVAGPGPRGLRALRLLAIALDGAEGRGKLIEAIARRPADAGEADRLYQRFREVLGADEPSRLDTMDAALVELLGAPPAGLDDVLPFLNDALELIDIGATTDRGAQA